MRLVILFICNFDGFYIIHFSDEEIYKKYRFNKETILDILDMIYEEISGDERALLNFRTIQPLLKLLLALYYSANGTFQIV